MNNRLLISAVSASLLTSCATTGDPEHFAVSDLPGREAQIVDGFDSAVRKVSVDVEWELRTRPRGFGTCKVEVNNVPDPTTFERSIRTDCFGTSRFDAAVMEIARKANNLQIPRYRYIVSTPQYRGALNWKVKAGRVTIAYYLDVPADTPIAYAEPYEAEAIHERARFPKQSATAADNVQVQPSLQPQPNPDPAPAEPAPAPTVSAPPPAAVAPTSEELRIYPAPSRPVTTAVLDVAPIEAPRPLPPSAPQARANETFYGDEPVQNVHATYRHQPPVITIPATYSAQTASKPATYRHVPPRITIPSSTQVTSFDGWVAQHGKDGYTFALHFSSSPISSAVVARYNADHLLVAKDEVRTDKPYVLLMRPSDTPEQAINEYQRVTGYHGSRPAYAWGVNELLESGLR